MRVGFTAVKIGLTGFILPFAFALNTDYITFGFNFQTLLTWACGYVICISLACALQGYVESKITIPERAGYLAVIALVISSNVLFSLIGIAVFAVLYGFRMLQAKKQRPVIA